MVKEIPCLILVHGELVLMINDYEIVVDIASLFCHCDEVRN